MIAAAQAALAGGALPYTQALGLPALRARIGLTDDEVARWGEMAISMFVPTHDTDGGTDP